MKTKILITFSCIGFLFLASCKEDCPAFPDHLVDYFPYRIGDSLLFVNQNNDTILFRVSEISITKESSISKCGKCKCETPELFVRAYSQYFTMINMGIFTHYEYFRIYFGIENGYLDGIRNAGSKLEDIFTTVKDPFDPKNSSLFSGTVLLDTPMYSDQQISKVIIIRGKGITEFYDQKFDIHWKII